MPARTPAERREIAELAAHARWSREASQSAAEVPAYADPLSAALIPPAVTDPVRRASMINHLISAHEIREARRRRAEQEAARELALAEARLAEITGGDAA